MNRRQVTTSMILGGAALALGQRESRQPAALAGGWASLELINPLGVAVVGVPTIVDAQMLRHGVNPDASLPGAMQFLNEETGEELIVRMEVVSDAHAIVRGEVTLNEAGTYRMQTWQMGPEISLGRMEAVDPASGDVISALRSAPDTLDTEVACSSGDTANVVETDILDGSFADPVLDVAVGTTVRWVNTSVVPHQVVFDNLAFDSSVMLHQDDTFSVTFAEAGEFDYFCGPHPWMVGTVSVGTGDA
ncbi:MAG: plastocyanin/azurin family copper-binding protein [Chloroflexota bacterium]|nr:plastocyanin/azurin family copper-binding protein [Chloroflexota bacterium]